MKLEIIKELDTKENVGVTLLFWSMSKGETAD